MILKRWEKQPREFKDYDVEYSPWLAHDSQDSLDAVEAVVSCLTNPDDTSLEVVRIEHTETVIKLWVAGGTAGDTYKVELIVTTTVGRIDESELIFKVKDR